MVMERMYIYIERYNAVREAHGLRTRQTDVNDGLNIILEAGADCRANKPGSKMYIF